MEEEGKRQEEELEWDLESMELKRLYPGIELLYWEYGTPENTWEKQELREDQGNQPQRWEDYNAWHSGTSNLHVMKMNPQCSSLSLQLLIVFLE